MKEQYTKTEAPKATTQTLSVSNLPSVRFARSFCPAPARAFGVPLLPFTVGHAIALDAAASPFGILSSFATQEASPTELLTAIWICSRPHEEAFRLLGSEQMMRTLKWWRCLAALKPRRVRVASLVLGQYMASAMAMPEIWVKAKQDSARAAGRPFWCGVLMELMVECHMSMVAALDLHVQQAFWFLCGAAEARGGQSIVSDREKLQMAFGS